MTWKLFEPTTYSRGIDHGALYVNDETDAKFRIEARLVRYLNHVPTDAEATEYIETHLAAEFGLFDLTDLIGDPRKAK